MGRNNIFQRVIFWEKFRSLGSLEKTLEKIQTLREKFSFKLTQCSWHHRQCGAQNQDWHTIPNDLLWEIRKDIGQPHSSRLSKIHSHTGKLLYVLVTYSTLLTSWWYYSIQKTENQKGLLQTFKVLLVIYGTWHKEKIAFYITDRGCWFQKDSPNRHKKN